MMWIDRVKSNSRVSFSSGGGGHRGGLRRFVDRAPIFQNVDSIHYTGCFLRTVVKNFVK